MRPLAVAIWSLISAICVFAYNENLVALAQAVHSSPNGIISIHDGNLSLFSGPRDYYLVMSFTSTKEEHGCQVCKTVPDIVGTVSKSWYQDYFDAQLLFFVEVDLVNPKNGAIFQVAQVTSVPQIVIIPPSLDKELHEDGSNQQLPLGYRMLREPRTVFQLPQDEIRKQSLALAQFVSEAVQKRITIREEDPQLAFLKNFFITLVIILVIKKKGSQYVSVTRKSAWCAVCIILVGFFVSGYSFTTMNGIAFLVQNDKGGLIYFSGGQSYQFGIEIFLVATNYILLGGALVLLIYMGQYKVTKDSRINSELTRFVLILGANGLLFLLYSFLTSAYLRKDGGYPYYLLRLF